MPNSKTLFEKLRGEESRPLNAKVLRFSNKLRIIIVVSTIVICSLFFPLHFDFQFQDKSDFGAQLGFLWTGETIKADYSFPIMKPYEIYKKELDDAGANASKVFSFNDISKESALIQIENYFANISKDGSTSQDKDVAELFRKTVGAKKAVDFIKLKKSILNLAEYAYTRGFVNIPISQITKPEVLVLYSNKIEKYFPTIDLIDSSALALRAEKEILEKFPTSASDFGTKILFKFCQPNYIYSQSLTDQNRVLNEKNIAKTKGIVKAGEILIEKGEKVDSLKYLQIKSYENARYLKRDKTLNYTIYFGNIGHAALIFSFLGLYLLYIRKRIFQDNFQLTILCGSLVATAFLSWLSVQVKTSAPIEYLIFIPAFSMLAAIVYDSRTAFYATVTMSLMLAGVRGNDYVCGASLMLAGTLAAYTVRDIQSRTQIFTSIFYIFIALLFAIVSFGLESSAEFPQMAQMIGFALLNALISPLLTFGLLFLLERVSNIATDLRLQEFDNLNHPLLAKLSESAPGTYQHTLTIARLAESCARAISANPLLARVGAYFHDIGKINRPEYFVENQIGIENKHAQLTPKKSAAAIRNHVVEGIRLAKETKLPKRIADFIPMHHGTSLIKHFYAMALEKGDTETVKEEDYRYPGPKPQFKEHAIVMIADSAEALSRVLSSTERDILEQAVDKIIRDKILDGQFDECDISLGELNTVKETCVKNLIGISHPRTIYKEIPQKPVDNEVENRIQD